ncbi:MAG: epoxyqueuosine reductase QueH [Candidatus Thermoplasmatota archaeon]
MSDMQQGTGSERKEEGGEERGKKKKKIGHGDRVETREKSLLLHTCCAPCLTYTGKQFKKLFEKVTALWFNPNIHPFKEYQERFQALRKYEKKSDMEVIYIDRYSLEDFLEGALKTDTRCDFCLKWRLEKTAEEAVERGYDIFSTTLVLSPYQDHDRLKRIGLEVASKRDIEFFYEDMRDGFEEHHRLADEMGLYKQGYCGCIFSEKERYHKKLLE